MVMKSPVASFQYFVGYVRSEKPVTFGQFKKLYVRHT